MKHLKDLAKNFIDNEICHPLDTLNEYGKDRLIYLFDYEYMDLCNLYGKEYIEVKIEDLANYMAAHGKNYHSHYHALKLFIRNDQCTCGAWKKNIRGNLSNGSE